MPSFVPEIQRVSLRKNPCFFNETEGSAWMALGLWGLRAQKKNRIPRRRKDAVVTNFKIILIFMVN